MSRINYAQHILMIGMVTGMVGLSIGMNMNGSYGRKMRKMRRQAANATLRMGHDAGNFFNNMGEQLAGKIR